MEDGKIGISVIIRDHSGSVVSYLSDQKNLMSLLIIAECCPLERAMKLCSEMGFDQVNLEGDTQIIIQATKKEEVYLAWYGELIEDAKLS